MFAAPFRPTRIRGIADVCARCAVVWLLTVAVAAAQTPPANGKAPAGPKIPAPEDVVLTARDGLEVDATYYGSIKGREAVPVVLLHTFKGNRADYAELAASLQSQGHAVIVPDLRGHGTTGKKKAGDRSSENPNPPRDFFLAMITNDMEAVKSFLMTKHNAGELNIERLCLVGAEMGATIAMNWAQYDWSHPVLLTGKQGQDVKGLVLISPEFAFRGISMKQAASDEQVRSKLSVLIVVGKGKPKSVQDADRVYKLFKPFHLAPEKLEELSREERSDRQDLFIQMVETTLQGTQLVNAKGLKVGDRIAQFIQLRLEKKSIPGWKERKTP
jgi:pimeloyl-ACP methyl ester carboxylesterase